MILDCCFAIRCEFHRQASSVSSKRVQPDPKLGWRDGLEGRIHILLYSDHVHPEG